MLVCTQLVQNAVIQKDGAFGAEIVHWSAVSERQQYIQSVLKLLIVSVRYAEKIGPSTDQD